MPGRKPISLAPRKRWILGGLFLALLSIIVAARYGEQWSGLFQKDRGRTQTPITGPATRQPFDHRLSLSMPVPFGPSLDFPLAKLPVEVREKVQKMTQRTAFFNGVYIVAMKMSNSPGNKGKLEESLFRAFSKTAKPPATNMPKVNSTKVEGVYESGAIRFPAVFGQSQGQMTVVVIQPDVEDAFWCVYAWGREGSADLAEKTATGFIFQ
jgi:hypothetical protein